MQKLLALIVAILAAPTVLANHTDPSECPSEDISIGIVEFGAGDAGSTFYVLQEAGGDLVVYQESNGIYLAGGSAHDNLQQDADHPYLPGRDDCVQESLLQPPDIKLFDSGADL